MGALAGAAAGVATGSGSGTASVTEAVLAGAGAAAGAVENNAVQAIPIVAPVIIGAISCAINPACKENTEKAAKALGNTIADIGNTLSNALTGNSEEAQKKNNAEEQPVAVAGAPAPLPPDDEDPYRQRDNPEWRPRNSVEEAIMDSKGNLRGERVGHAKHGVRTVSRAEFEKIKSELMENVVGEPEPLSNSNGFTYTTKDGGKFNIRMSVDHGETIDINVTNLPGLPKGTRFHWK